MQRSQTYSTGLEKGTKSFPGKGLTSGCKEKLGWGAGDD